jgi:arylsulfatase/uncharacterized sulfatase
MKVKVKVNMSKSAGLACALMLMHGWVLAAKQPNVVLILADDLGFSDTQPYGGEIRTPSINELAATGVSFTNYHTSASCAPSRAMLLTGVDSHINGVPNIPEAIPPQQKKHSNYQGELDTNVVTVASLLYDAGYHTYMAGKWHLGKQSHQLPFNRGFERTLSMADTGSDNWQAKPYLPLYNQANWTQDGEAAMMPKDFYSSELLIDKTIEFIDSNIQDQKPFFAYVPFLAVHIPVQAPKSFTERYTKVYQDGWKELRRQRQEQAKKLGVVPIDSLMNEMDTSSDWDSFSEDEKQYHAKRMAVYAGMVEAMDFHIGRLITHLKHINQYDNTIFIFTSDNGSEASGSDTPLSIATQLGLGLTGYNNDYTTLGEKGSFNSIGPSFASAAASPLSYYKFYAGEGGMRVPMIISGAPLSKYKMQHNTYEDALTYVMDITPTILELTNVKHPENRYGGRRIEAMGGRSLLPMLSGNSEYIYGPEETIGYEVAGNKALFQGDYKIMYNTGPVGDNQWHLYNIAADPGETQDLKNIRPEHFENMKVLYAEYEKLHHIQPLPAGYNQQRQLVLNGVKKIIGTELFTLMLTLLTVLGFYFIYRFKKQL